MSSGRKKPPARRSASASVSAQTPTVAPDELRRQLLGEIAQTLGHETRNILSSLSTCLQLLRRDPARAPDDRELIEIMQSGMDRLSEIADQFAAFRPRRANPVEAADLREIISAAVQRLRQDERYAAAIVVQQRFNGRAYPLLGNRAQLICAFWNVLLNAAQALGDDGRIEIVARKTAGGMVAQIRDSGPGIAPAHRGKIFDPLFTTKTRATGLGLTIARLIFQEHGGTIDLAASGPGGTCFTVTLPLPQRLGEKIGNIQSARAGRRARAPGEEGQ